MNKYNKVRVLACDHLNLARGKYVPGAHADDGKIHASLGIFAVSFDRQMVDTPNCGFDSGFPDLTAVYDVNDIRQAWEDDTGVVVADLMGEGGALPLCGRGILKRTLQEWAAHGYQVHLGIELEGYIYERDENKQWRPYHTPGAYVYGTGPSVDPDGLMDAVWQTADKLGFEIESMCSEYDWPQFEFTLKYNEALTALDDLFLFKLLTKEVLMKKGFLLSYMPKPINGRGGSGMHLNISLTDKDGNNVLNDLNAKDGLADITKRMIAGLSAHHQSMCALMCPTVNSYKRLRPSNICGHVGNWGYDHRCATTRIPLERGKATRIEHRLADCAANPYIAAAAALQACKLGFEKNYDIPEPEPSQNFSGSLSNNFSPETLGLALDALEKDSVFVDAIGAEMVQHFSAMKRKEWNDFLDHTTDWEINNYFDFI